ncbi:uncharacterized protein LOC100370596 [Saccoglossus kowalevskii]
MATIRNVFAYFILLLFLGFFISTAIYSFGIKPVSKKSRSSTIRGITTFAGRDNAKETGDIESPVAIVTVSDHGSSEETNDNLQLSDMNESSDRQSDTDSFTVDTSVTHYLVPIHHFGSGPNFNFRNFRIAVLIALYNKMTIVERWFQTHGTQARSWRYLNETFDVTLLRKLLDVAYFDRFKRECDSNVDVVITTPSRSKDVEKIYERHSDIFEVDYGIQLPPWSQIKSITRLSDLESIRNIRCVGVYYPLAFEQFNISGKDELLRKVDKHLKWPTSIRRVADLVSDLVCGGRPYLSVHFRTKVGEGCKNDNCNKTQTLATGRAALQVSFDFSNLMKTRNLSCIYVALPPYAADYEDIFQQKLPNVITMKQLTDNTTIPELAKISDDNYKLSLLEQELCIRSTVFVSWVYSYWSQMVIYQRELQKAESFNIKDFPHWDVEGLNLV